MTRASFTALFIGLTFIFEAIRAWLGFGFDYNWVIAVCILVPACAFIMPDRSP